MKFLWCFSNTESTGFIFYDPSGAIIIYLLDKYWKDCLWLHLLFRFKSFQYKYLYWKFHGVAILQGNSIETNNSRQQQIYTSLAEQSHTQDFLWISRFLGKLMNSLFEFCKVFQIAIFFYTRIFLTIYCDQNLLKSWNPKKFKPKRFYHQHFLAFEIFIWDFCTIWFGPFCLCLKFKYDPKKISDWWDM